MPNYHLFASSASVRSKHNTNNGNKKSHKNKKSNVPLELLCMRMGCRNVKTLLSANKENLWHDVNIIVNNDIISDVNHHIATIRKKNRNTSAVQNSKLQPG